VRVTLNVSDYIFLQKYYQGTGPEAHRVAVFDVSGNEKKLDKEKSGNFETQFQEAIQTV